MPDDNGLIGAVDLGGTKILSLAVERDGHVAGEDVRPTEASAGPDAVIARITESLRAALANAGAARYAAIGAAVPGPIDVEHGVVVQAPNLPGWRDVAVARRLSEQFGCPALLENDANAAAWGEFTRGAGRDVRNMVYLTVSTGIGGGLVLDGRLYRGANGAAGELGHLPLAPDGPPCGCGSRGCLEQLASGTAIARDASALLAAGHAPILARLMDGQQVTAELVSEAAAKGEVAARSVIEQAGRSLGLGLVAITNVFNPDLIVIGGGAAKIGPLLWNPALAELDLRAMRLARSHVRVVPAALGDRAGAIGVADLAAGLVH